jgi:hypothetical protein
VSRAPSPGRDDASGRAQSHVVGVVLLLGLSAIALGGLTAAVGTVVDRQTAHADAERVATDLAALDPVATTGDRTVPVRFSEGDVAVEPRDLRVLDDGTVVERVAVDALVWESGDRRVASLAGAVVRGDAGRAWLEREPPVVAGPDVVVVGAVTLDADGAGSLGGTGGVRARLRTDVAHDRTNLSGGEWAVAIETATPGPFERYAERIGADTRVESVDGDGVDSVVVEFDGTRRGYLVVHDLNLEVGP